MSKLTNARHQLEMKASNMCRHRRKIPTPDNVQINCGRNGHFCNSFDQMHVDGANYSAAEAEAIVQVRANCCARQNNHYAGPLVAAHRRIGPHDNVHLHQYHKSITREKVPLLSQDTWSPSRINPRFVSLLVLIIATIVSNQYIRATEAYQNEHNTPAAASTSATTTTISSDPQQQSSGISQSESVNQPHQTNANSACFGGLQTFEKISMSSFENPTTSDTTGAFGGGILIQQDDQALTSECVNLCRSQANCLSFVIDYNKFECKSYATTQQELQQEFDAKYQSARAVNNSTATNSSEPNGYPDASTINIHQLLPSTSSNYFEKICLDGVANRNQFSDVCGQGRLWTIERVVDSFLDGYVEKEVTNVNNKDECSKLCLFETQFVCRSADYDQHSRLCRLSKEDRRTQPQAMRFVAGSNRQYLENQCATPGPSSCVYEVKKNLAIISMDALKFAQTAQDCQMKCNQETTFNCRSYSFNQQRCFLSGDDSYSLNTNLIKLPVKQGWQFGEKKCLVESCTKGIFSYERITGYTLRSALSTSIDLMMASGSSDVHVRSSSDGSSIYAVDDGDKLSTAESSQVSRPQRHLFPAHINSSLNSTSSLVSTMMMLGANNNEELTELLQESASSRHARSSSNLAITEHCRHSCDLGYLNCPAFTIDYRNNRCQRLDRNSQGRHQELVARDGFAYYEKICLRVPEIMSMCQDKYWIFDRVIGYELAPRLYEKSLKFVQSRRDCEEYCLEEKQFQCRSAYYNDETSDCKLSRYDRRLALQEGAYYKNFNVRISYLENQCVRDHNIDRKCYYEKVKDEPAYPTYTERIEMAHPNPPPPSTNTGEANYAGVRPNATASQRFGASYCEQLCNDNAKFECHSFGYYASTAQCFLSGDDTISAGELATTPSTGFTYHEKRCRLSSATATTTTEDPASDGASTPQNNPTTTNNLNPYFQPPRNEQAVTTPMSDISSNVDNPPLHNNNNNNYNVTTATTTSNIGNDSHSLGRPRVRPPGLATYDGPNPANTNNISNLEPDHYKCGHDHTFVYQRISGFEPIGGYLTLLVKSDDSPGIIAECSEMCKRAYECRAFVVDYESNQCFAMLENSSIGLLSLRQTLGKDYFEGFCVANHLLQFGLQSCRSKSWIMDKIVDQAVVGVQHQKLIPDSDRVQCRQACLEERLFTCKSAMFDSATAECKLYSIDRESIPQMRLSFTKGVDFYENQCQILSSTCPFDAIERDMTILMTTKSIQASSTFDCEVACNSETSFNCRSYTYLDKYPSLPNLCLLSSDSRSTSQKGSVRDHPRTLYAERNCFYRRARYPGLGLETPKAVVAMDAGYGSIHSMNGPTVVDQTEPYRRVAASGRPGHGHSLAGDRYDPQPTPPRISAEEEGPSLTNHHGQHDDVGPALGQGCEPHQYTFERTFGYDFRVAQKERASISPTIGIAIGCQQECLKRGDRCQSFVVEYALPYQNCFLIENSVGANKRLLVKSPNSAYFEKVCLPRTGVEPEPLMLMNSPSQVMATSGNQPVDPQSMDISPSYSHEPWSPQIPNQLPYYLQQQQLVQNYPSRSCAKLWSFERFVNYNFTATSDRTIENSLTRVHCETQCLNEASFSCRAATYDYANKVCRLFKNTRRTMMSQLVDLENPTSSSSLSVHPQHQQQPPPSPVIPPSSIASHPGTAHVINSEVESIQAAASGTNSVGEAPATRRQTSARQLLLASASNQQQQLATAEPSSPNRNIDYLENTCVSEPSSCQYRQIYDQFSPYIDKVTHAISMGDCQRQCDLERLFSCKSINYDAISRSCMLLNEDLISLNRGQQQQHQAQLLPKKNAVYSEKGNCEMISVQCNSREMLVSINFDSPFRGRIMAKGNPEQCYLIGDGQSNIQFPIVFGPKCNSRQEGHNNFVNEVVIQQHPVIMTENDKTVRVMCAFEAPEQTITLKNPSSRDNKTGIDVNAPSESSRTRHDKQQFNSVVSNKAAPPSVVLRILDHNGRDASMINLGDDLILKIQMQMEGQNSALGIFARNLAARSSNGESLLLIDNDGCPVDHQVFPALEIDPKDGKSLYSTFKAFRFPSSGLVNFEVQIRFCPEKCEPVECHKKHRSRSYGRRKRDLTYEQETMAGDAPMASAEAAMSNRHRTPVLQSVQQDQVPEPLATSLNAKSTVMNGKTFEYVRKLLLVPHQQNSETSGTNAGPSSSSTPTTDFTLTPNDDSTNNNNLGQPAAGFQSSPDSNQSGHSEEFDSHTSSTAGIGLQVMDQAITNLDGSNGGAGAQQSNVPSSPSGQENYAANSQTDGPSPSSVQMEQAYQQERLAPGGVGFASSRGLLNPAHSQLAPYGRFHYQETERNQVGTVNPLQTFPQSSASDIEPPQPPPPPVTTQASSGANIDENLFTVGYSTTKRPSGSNVEPLEEFDPLISTTLRPPPLVVATPTDPNDVARPKLPQGETTTTTTSPNSNKDMPLRFSILVGENQPTRDGWAPINQPSVLVMNSTNVDMDHVVIPGKIGQPDGSQELGSSGNHLGDQVATASKGPQADSSQQDVAEQSSSLGGRHPMSEHEQEKRGTSAYEQPFDALPSNSITSEISLGVTRGQHDTDHRASKHSYQDGAQQGAESPGAGASVAASASASQGPCQAESGRSRLRTIIWTGGIVIALNICLVLLSLALYFRKVHLRKDHTIVRSSSSCGTQISSEGGGGGRWPSVLLKSKNDLSTSLNTHEQFFYKLNHSSRQQQPHHSSTRPNDQSEYSQQWPNLATSTRSSHSTISSMASPLPSSSIRISHMRPSLKSSPFDCNSSLRSGNFNTGSGGGGGYHGGLQRTILDVNQQHHHHEQDKFNARFTSNIDELGPQDRF